MKNKKYIPLVLAALYFASCHNYVKPEPNQSQETTQSKNANEDSRQEKTALKLVEIIRDECDRAYIAELKGNNVVVCDEEADNGRYRQLFGINLGTACDVYIIERHFPWLLEYLWGDILCVNTNIPETYCLTMSDSVVKEAGSLLQSYIMAEGRKCNETQFPLPKKNR